MADTTEANRIDYVVRIIGHVIENRRPEGFPKQVVHTMFLQPDSIKQLNETVNEQVNIFLQVGGMIALKNPAEMQEMNTMGQVLGLDKFMFVPMTMLSYMETITNVVNIQPPTNPEGEVRLQ